MSNTLALIVILFLAFALCAIGFGAGYVLFDCDHVREVPVVQGGLELYSIRIANEEVSLSYLGDNVSIFYDIPVDYFCSIPMLRQEIRDIQKETTDAEIPPRD